MTKGKKIRKITLRIILILLAALVLFLFSVFIFHNVKRNEEIALLKEKGYYNPVSVGDHSLNVAKFGNENGKHTIVGMAGLGMGDYSVTARQMTASLEEDNLVVFIDRAGYGFSDGTDADMTLDYIVEDYRKALQNAGIEGPYILMPHSISGLYATYWVSKYPDEIEAVTFVDCTQLDENIEKEQAYQEVSFNDHMHTLLCKMGLSRLVLRDNCYLYSTNFSEEDQIMGDALMMMTWESLNSSNEAGRFGTNGLEAFNGIVKNDVPKLYICASLGFDSKESIIENNIWVNEQIKRNGLSFPERPTDYDDNDESLKKMLETFDKARKDTIYPYAEKMGNCQVVLLGGDHQIYQQKPEESGKILKEFIDGLK